MMEERSRLAGEMHDGLQPMLSGLSFYLEAADSKLKDGLKESVDDALERSRTFSARSARSSANASGVCMNWAARQAIWRTNCAASHACSDSGATPR
jgi:hypothetical protein